MLQIECGAFIECCFFSVAFFSDGKSESFSVHNQSLKPNLRSNQKKEESVGHALPKVFISLMLSFIKLLTIT